MKNPENGYDLSYIKMDGVESQNTTPFVRRAIDRVKDAKVTVAGTLGLIAVNVMYGDSLAVQSTDSLGRQMAMAVPSAFGTPQATGVRVLDFGGVTAFTATGLEMARRTTTLTELGAIAATAQIVSCGSDTIVSRIDPTFDTLDVGSSAMSAAWITKFMLDRAYSADDATTRRRWRLGAAAFAGVMTVGTYAFLGGDNGAMNIVAHGSAMTVGAVAHRFGRWRKNLVQ